MTNHVLVYFPHNPWPPRTGAHRRCLQMLDALVQIGALVDLASTTLFSDQPWTEAAIGALEARGVQHVWLYKRFRTQASLVRWEARFRGGNHWHFCSWWIRRWLSNLVYGLHESTVLKHL